MTGIRQLSLKETKKEFDLIAQGKAPKHKGEFPEIVYEYVKNNCEQCSPVEEVAKKVSQNIEYTINIPQKNTGIDISDAEVADIPDHIGGLYNTEAKGNSLKKEPDIALNQNLMLSPDLVYVANHEATHKQAWENFRKKYGQANMMSFIPVEFEEGLCEGANDRDFNRTSTVYVEYKALVNDIARTINKPVGELQDLYKAGEFPTLANIWHQYQYIKNRTSSQIFFIIKIPEISYQEEGYALAA